MLRMLVISLFLVSSVAVAHARHDSIFGFDHSFIPEDRAVASGMAADDGDDGGDSDNGDNGGDTDGGDRGDGGDK